MIYLSFEELYDKLFNHETYQKHKEKMIGLAITAKFYLKN